MSFLSNRFMKKESDNNTEYIAPTVINYDDAIITMNEHEAAIECGGIRLLFRNTSGVTLECGGQRETVVGIDKCGQLGQISKDIFVYLLDNKNIKLGGHAIEKFVSLGITKLPRERVALYEIVISNSTLMGIDIFEYSGTYANAYICASNVVYYSSSTIHVKNDSLGIDESICIEDVVGANTKLSDLGINTKSKVFIEWADSVGLKCLTDLNSGDIRITEFDIVQIVRDRVVPVSLRSQVETLDGLYSYINRNFK